MGKDTVLKKGTDEWWLWVSMLEVAKSYRKLLRLFQNAPAVLDMKDLHEFVQSVNRNPFKKLWLLLTVKDLTVADREKLGSEVMMVKEDGSSVTLVKKGEVKANDTQVGCTNNAKMGGGRFLS